MLLFSAEERLLQTFDKIIQRTLCWVFIVSQPYSIFTMLLIHIGIFEDIIALYTTHYTQWLVGMFVTLFHNAKGNFLQFIYFLSQPISLNSMENKCSVNFASQVKLS